MSELFDKARQPVSRSLIESIAPGGEWKSDGDYWPCSPLRSDAKPGSFHISADGQWYDFAAGEGGDFIELVAKVRGLKPKEAAEWILGQTGHDVPEKPKSARKPKAAPVIPIPPDAAAPLNREIASDYARQHHGKVGGGWRYHTADGGWAFAVVRYDKTDGSKDVIPYYYGTDNRWHEGQAYKDGRPLYRLPEIPASPDMPVLVVEGEKCASVEVPGWIVTTWSAGASSVGKTDWTPLEGRRVVVWPDFDEPGRKAAREIVKRLPQAEILNLENPSHLLDDFDRFDGWDVADAIAQGLDVAAFLENCPRISTEEPELPETDDEEDTPFRAIGYDANGYWFLLGSQRQPFVISKGNFNGSKLGELAPPAWWEKHRAISDKGAIDVTRAQQIVIDLQNRRGMFDPSTLRGAGVWQEPAGIIIHDGEHIVSPGGERVPLAEYKGGAEYVRSQVRFGEMTGPEASADEGRALAELFSAQRWQRGVDSAAVLGWSLIAPFGGLLSFRPHIWITGKKGTGKTFVLENLLREICGPFAHTGSGKDTEAGIRRTLNMDARPVILDEMEPKGKARENVTKLLDLARNASSDGSGRVTMADGKGTVSFLIRSCFCFASINTSVEEGAAIASRIIVSELRPARSVEDERRKIAESKRLYREAMHDPARYRRRIFRALPRIIEDIEALREKLPASLGGAREADLWAPVFAAAWAVQSDESVTGEEGMEWLARQLDDEEATRCVSGEDEDRVIEHILAAQILNDDRKSRTIAELLHQAWARDPTEADADSLLGRHGIRLYQPPSMGGVWVVAIASNHDALGRILRDTPYGTGYDAQVKRNPMCKTPDKKYGVRMGGGRCECRLLDWEQFRKRYMEASE